MYSETLAMVAGVIKTKWVKWVILCFNGIKKKSNKMSLPEYALYTLRTVYP